MRLVPTPIPGAFEVQFEHFGDDRGTFTKVFRRSEFEAAGLTSEFAEEYFSTSVGGVVRGMHFQLPPHDHVKLVYCSAGRVLDVVVDLRVGSPVFGMAHSFELSAELANGLYLPKGVAHGFCTPHGPATMDYHVTSEYEPASDTGVRWDTIGFDWAVPDPVISVRDCDFVAFGDFVSPFVLDGE